MNNKPEQQYQGQKPQTPQNPADLGGGKGFEKQNLAPKKKIGVEEENEEDDSAEGTANADAKKVQ